MSNSSILLVKDILDAAEKYGAENVLVADLENVRSPKKGGNDCNWIPVLFKHANGTDMKYHSIKFMKVILASGAKKGDVDSNKMVIAFRKFTKEEINTGDYVAREMDNEEDQLKENKRIENLVDTLYKNTNDLVDALDIIDKSWKKMTNDIKKAKSLKFTLVKNKQFKKETIPIFGIKQTHRTVKIDGAEDVEEELPVPMYRIKLLANKNGEIGHEAWNKDIKRHNFRECVYDLRKMSLKANSGKAILARIKEDGKLKPLTLNNANKFITFRSMAGGVIEFKDIVVSKFGLSFDNKFTDIYVKKHRAGEGEEEAMVKEIVSEMCDSNDDGSDSDSDNEVAKAQSSDEETDTDLDDANVDED